MMPAPDPRPRIALVTPLKNEISNLPDLIDRITRQTTLIDYWIIVENGSNDGSREYLAESKNLPNVTNFIVIHFTLPDERYELGEKYSTVVNQGFTYMISNNLMGNIDCIGICDADCFPGPDYYKRLTSFMRANPKIGISSGIGYSLEGKHDGEGNNWVRGNCRLWKKECFMEAGYIVGPSADTLSLCKAELKGWLAMPDTSLIYYCREVGQKVNYSYYGYSAYFRGISPLYAFFKAMNFLALRRPSEALNYFKGYFQSYFNQKERISDLEIRGYFANYLFEKLKRYRK